nr:transient receptor potential-gamma protein-like [Leptinotarsa decemlineata]
MSHLVSANSITKRQSGLIWSEIKQLWDVGLEEYVRDMWNVIDFITNSLYVATVALRIVSIYQVKLYPNASEIRREHWDAWDPMLISEGLFSAANIFSSLKLVYIFSVNPHLGPLQVSLSRMVMDIMKFFFLFVLVLFAFSCGLNQLLWYYADAERTRCRHEGDDHMSRNQTEPDSNACTIWRRFSNLFETSQTLFWAVFGLIDLESFELNEIKIFTRFWGMLMFGTYSVINIVVLLNLLIAMMNHSYQLISERADSEWKFARSKLWISYFEEGGTVPVPFNIIPTPKSLWYIIEWIRRKFCGYSRAAKKEHMRTIRRKVKKASERDFRYQGIMRNLVRRYVTVEQRKAENQGVTEDDVNEIKQDISAFRFELIEILKNSGMNTSTAHNVMGTGGKKNRQKERRLMKGFNIAPQPSTSSASLPPVAEFIASLQQHHDDHHHHHDFFGSTLSGIFANSTPRKLHQQSSTVSSSQGSINEGLHHHHNHHKRSESLSDSNPSLDVQPDIPRERELHGIAHGLALLKKKRKKFSASRNTSPIIPPTNPIELSHKKFQPVKALKRASSVPTRVPEMVQITHRHEKTQSQQDSIELPTTVPSTLTPSTTEESVNTVGQPTATSGTSRDPLLFNSSSSNPANGSLQTPDEEYRHHSSQSLPKLPGVIPLCGHTAPTGWL